MSNSKFFNPKSVVITSVDGTQFVMTATVGAFSYYEDIFTPFVSANMVVVDSGQNLIGNLPIQGGERVIFTLDNVKGEVVEYELYVYKVYNRVVDKNRQMYNLALLSKEAMTNEARVTKKMKAHPEQIVSDVLTTNLGVQEDKILPKHLSLR